MEVDLRKVNLKTYTVKVTNNICGRVDIHYGLTKDDIGWIATDPNLSVEFLDKKTKHEVEE